MKFNGLCLLAAISLFSGNAVAETEWIHKTLMGNTLPQAKCAAKSLASENATKSKTIDDYGKRFCATQGYGWALAEVKNQGKVVCEPCGSGKGDGEFNCHVEDVVAECRRIKPGSVGMLPGKG